MTLVREGSMDDHEKMREWIAGKFMEESDHLGNTAIRWIEGVIGDRDRLAAERNAALAERDPLRRRAVEAERGMANWREVAEKKETELAEARKEVERLTKERDESFNLHSRSISGEDITRIVDERDAALACLREVDELLEETETHYAQDAPPGQVRQAREAIAALLAGKA